MNFKVEGMAFEGFALVTSLHDWTHATTGTCLRVEYGGKLYSYFKLVSHSCGGGGHHKLNYIAHLFASCSDASM